MAFCVSYDGDVECGGGGVVNAGDVVFAPSGDYTSTNLQDAVLEAQTIVDAKIFNMSHTFGFARNSGNTTDQWLRKQDGTPANLSPYVVAYDSDIIAVAGACDIAQTWDAEIYRNSDIVSGIPIGTPLAILMFSASKKEFVRFGAPVALSAGDTLAVFLRGTSIDYPSIDIHVKPRKV